MTFELDHLFICTSMEAPQANRLIEFGLTEGTRNVHTEQGTSNRRFFFCNGMIELLWLHSEEEAKSDVIAPTRLYERCKHRETGASPFGLCLRPAHQEETDFPFDCWPYRPPYLPQNLSLYVAVSSTSIDEPMLFYIPFNTRPDKAPAGRRQPLEHAAGFREITAVRITMPKAQPYSTALRAVENMGWASFTSGGEHLIEVYFDNEKQGKSADFRPELPLIFSW
ncbi:MAG: hypothetical protein L0Y56_07535 [Nitrospira sp.]|nr:hypothetical protein [Nitrospira sp.]